MTPLSQGGRVPGRPEQQGGLVQALMFQGKALVPLELVQSPGQARARARGWGDAEPEHSSGEGNSRLSTKLY